MQHFDGDGPNLHHPMQTLTSTSPSSDCEIVSSRIFDFPRDRVFRAWTEPELLKLWWGPNGFTNTFHEFNLRPGGDWRFVMHGPNGVDYRNHSVFLEIVKPERLIFDHVSPPRFQVRATFEDLGHKTRVTFRMVFTTAEECARIKPIAVGANEENFDRLTAVLTTLTAERPFVLTRVFDAPRDLVWAAWTETRHMQWWGPKEVTIHHAKLDLRPGGIFHYCMRSADGQEMWGKWAIREVARPERLVFVNSFADPAGNVTRHPLSTTWPLETLSTITFAERNGKTEVTIHWLPLNATEAERMTFDQGHESMRAGWTGSLDRLEEYLTTLVCRSET